MRVDKGKSLMDKWRMYQWLNEWPLEPPFPGMVSGLNKFGEAYWATPVKVFTQEEIAAYVSKSS